MLGVGLTFPANARHGAGQPGLRVSGQVRWRYSTGAVAVNVTTAGQGLTSTW